VFRGQVDPAHQIHDFNPGIDEHGVFWTTRIPDHSVHADLDHARARMHVSDFEVEDYHDLFNALQDGPSIPARVWFDIRWSGVSRRVSIRDVTNRFSGRYIEDTATVSWRAEERGARFRSDPADTSTSEFAVIGRERNGVFFPN
jgi:hypothetical protein